MEEALARRARAFHGLLSRAELGSHPGRTAQREGLVVVQPRIYIAATQPVAAGEQVAAERESVTGGYAFVDRTALWLHGLGPCPDVVRVGVAHALRCPVRPPVELTRVAPQVLRGARVVDGSSVVALEMALVQSARTLPAAELGKLLESALRSRLTTIPRLRVEVRFVNDNGASAYADLLDDESSTLFEVDDFLTHLERNRFRADRRRDWWLHAEHGVTTFRIDGLEIVEDLDALADELVALVLHRRPTRQAG